MKQILTQKLQQKLTPQQILLMKLIQLPARELEMRMKKEIEENPVLEDNTVQTSDTAETEDEYGDAEDNYSEDLELDSYDSDDYYGYSDDTESKSDYFSLSVHESLQEDLSEQISLKIDQEPDLSIALYIIGSLDDSGYLRRDLGSIVDDLAFKQNIFVEEEDVDRVLKVVQQLDPPGIAARDLRESLLLQLERMNEHTLVHRNALHIVEHLFDDFTHKRYERIIEKTSISEDDLKEVLHEIQSLNPKPGEPQEDINQMTSSIIPDFTVNVVDDELELLYNGAPVPELQINKSYLDMLEDKSKNKSKAEKETSQFIKQKVESAKWFIDAIKQREETLTNTIATILDIQKEFFLHGDERYLKPMILKDVADKINLDISTISRVVNSKYVQTPYGIFQLKKFFSESFTKDSGEEVSTKEVKKILSEVIEAEDKNKPLKDDELTEILKDKGYPIARRTIAKYREQLGIPVARLRRKL